MLKVSVYTTLNKDKASYCWYILCTDAAGECLYNTEEQLFKKVKEFCHNPSAARDAKIGTIVCVFSVLPCIVYLFFRGACV